MQFAAETPDAIAVTSHRLHLFQHCAEWQQTTRSNPNQLDGAMLKARKHLTLAAQRVS